MNYEKKVLDRAEKIQSEMLQILKENIDPKKYIKGTYNDYMIVGLMTYIAELQIQVEELRNKIK